MAGLGALLALVGVPVGLSDAVVQVVGGVAAVAAIVMTERGAK